MISERRCSLVRGKQFGEGCHATGLTCFCLAADTSARAWDKQVSKIFSVPLSPSRSGSNVSQVGDSDTDADLAVKTSRHLFSARASAARHLAVNGLFYVEFAERGLLALVDCAQDQALVEIFRAESFEVAHDATGIKFFLVDLLEDFVAFIHLILGRQLLSATLLARGDGRGGKGGGDEDQVMLHDGQL